MGYSDSNYQIGRMLHKEYEATYAAGPSYLAVNGNEQKRWLKPASLLSIVMVASVLTALTYIV